MDEFELELERSRSEVAEHLHQLAEGLEGGDTVTLIVGEESVTINPPETLLFKIETETDSSWLGGDDGRSLEIELGWEAPEDETAEELLVINHSKPERRDRTRAPNE